MHENRDLMPNDIVKCPKCGGDAEMVGVILEGAPVHLQCTACPERSGLATRGVGIPSEIFPKWFVKNS